MFLREMYVPCKVFRRLRHNLLQRRSAVYNDPERFAMPRSNNIKPEKETAKSLSR